MPGMILMVDGNDQSHFSLNIDGQTLTIGDSPDHAEALLQGVRIKRIHCEIELDDDTVLVSNLANTDVEAALDEELLPGAIMQLAHAQLHVEPVVLQEPAADEFVAPDDVVVEQAAPPEAAPVAPEPALGLRKRFHVIDGPDQGKSFALPDTGPIYIGKSHRHAEIILHDLYVSRVHCELQIEGDRLTILHVEGPNGTLVNGERITGPRDLHIGDVVRIGNSHLKLEVGVHEAEPEIPEVELEVVDEPQAAPPRTPIDQLFDLQNHALGHFQLGQSLGSDHVGMVFRATDTKTNQLVALKVLAADVPAAQAELEHFVQAMKSAAKLHHPNLVALHGAGKTGHHCWIAREFVEGESVATLIERSQKEAQFKWKKAGRVAVHLARALGYLEQRKLAHRGITPTNVLVREADKLTKLADVMLEEGLKGNQGLDKKSVSALRYLAPEQMGSNEAVDHRADLYSLGAVLYHMVTGQLPFSGDTPSQILEHMKGKLVKPSKLQSNIPPEFEAVITRLLAYFPKDRYQAAAELLRVVEPIAQEHQIKL